MNKSFLLLYLFLSSLLSFGQERPDQNLNTVITDTKGIVAIDNGISFLAIGDFGRHGHFTQKDVARDMGSVAEILDLNFTVSVGDNFYPTGVQSTQDYQWISSFENIYTHHLLHEPWYVALGNHDYEGNMQAQIDYSQVSRRWEMPAPYFEKIIKIDKENSLQLLIIDTNPYVESYFGNDEKFPQLSAQDTQKQMEWLEERLNDKNPKIKWRIVVGHHPLYSGGKRKTNKDTYQIRDLFVPVFQKYKIDAYICGHEHDLQIIKQHDFVQFLSGAGSELRESGNTEGTIYADAVPGFMAFTLSKNILTTYVIKSNKEDFEVMYKNEIKK